MNLSKSLKPKYIFVWLLILLLKVASKIKFRTQVKLGTYIGNFFYLVFKKQRKTARINISRCFPEKNKKQVDFLLRKNFESLGIAYFEISNALFKSKDEIQSLIKESNIDVLTDLISKEKNIIILTAHFSPMILAGRALINYHTVAASYKPQKNPLFEKIYKSSFVKNGALMIDNRDMRSTLKALLSGIPLWIVPDQDIKSNSAIFVPFFGIETATITSPSRLASKENTVVLPYLFVRDKDGYRMMFEEPVQNFPSQNIYQDMTKINSIFENQIRQFPEQYLWTHPRFKTRPEGESDYYKNV